MDSKKPWQSKTILLNGVAGLLLFLGLFIPGAAPAQAWIQAHAEQIGIVWSMLNVVLRAITKDKISLGD